MCFYFRRFLGVAALTASATLAAGLNPATVPLVFNPNSGQEDAAVRFVSRGPGYSLAFTSQETILTVSRAGHTGTLRLNVVHTRPDATVSAVDELPAKVNYIIGRDPAKWHIGIASYGKVLYKSVLAGVDLVYYGKGRTLEYDFRVAPGVDPRKIEIAIGGGDWTAKVMPAGDLGISSQAGSIVFDKPVAYQVAADGSHQTVAARYWLKKGKRFGFHFGSYDHDRELIIDPSVAWATFYGGSNYEYGTSIALDTQGNVYLAGYTNSVDLPGTSGGYQPSPKPPNDNTHGGNGGYTGFLAKFNPTGTQLIYATYLGGSTSGGDGQAGSQINDAIFGVAVDAQGDAVVVGATDSTDFPLQNAVQTTCGPQNNINNFYCTVTPASTCPTQTADAFVTKLNPTGSGLIYSTYLGGSGWDQANAVAVNSAGEAFVTGNTNSVIEHDARGVCGANVINNSVPFLTTANAYYARPAANSNPDPATAQTYAFLTKLSASGALEYSSYYGPQLSGTTNESLQTLGSSIALDSANNVYLAGQTNDTNFPTTIPGTNIGQCNNCNNGNWNGWVAKFNLNNSGSSQLIYNNLFGGSAADYVYSIAVDAGDNAYLSGNTTSSDYPITQGAFQTKISGLYGGDAFVSKLNAQGTTFVYSTYLHGSGNIGGNSGYVAVNGADLAIVSGGGNQTASTCCAFLTELSADGSETLYSYAYGGWNTNGGPVTVDSKGNAYVIGTSQGGVPTTPGAFAACPNLNNCATNGGAYDIYAAKFTFAVVPNDFAGNGHSGELLYDPTQGQSYTAISNGDGTYQYVPNLFTAHFDTLRTGDYNGDGKADLILYNSQTGAAYIGFGKGDGTFNFQSLFWSPGYNVVATGDINGDGKTDVALYNSTTGTLYTGISNGDGTFTYQYHLVSQGFTFVKLADFTGSGKAGLLLYNSNTGLAFLGVGDGTGNFSFHALSVSPGYSLGDVGDLNGDGKADVILYNPTSGNAATGISDGMGGFTFTPLVFSPGFTSVRLGDYTGHATADVTVYNKNTAVAYFGTGKGDGTFNFQSLFWSPGYDYVIAEDVNGDGKADVILYSSPTGTEYTGISNGNATFSYTYSYWGIGKLLASQ